MRNQSRHTHQITVVNAGHMPPLIRHNLNQIEEPGKDQVGLPIGIMADIEYSDCKFTLKPEELFLLYTDGINESVNTTGEMYGIDRIKLHTSGAASETEKLGKVLVKDVTRHIGNGQQNDDMCMVIVGRLT